MNATANLDKKNPHGIGTEEWLRWFEDTDRFVESRNNDTCDTDHREDLDAETLEPDDDEDQIM